MADNAVGSAGKGASDKVEGSHRGVFGGIAALFALMEKEAKET
jgi:hypothetical protein